MPDGITIRPSTPADRDTILAFIERMGFNARDAITWDALRMCAMTAWRGDLLVGAIPMEPRPLQLRPGRIIPIVHETVVAVAPEERSRGLGSRMQEVIAQVPPHEAVLATVFREEPASAAYRWYVRNGFTPLMRIDSWFHDEPAGDCGEVHVHDLESDPPPWAALAALWSSAAGASGGGFVDRRRRDLGEWLRVHPYRARYTFFVSCIHDGPTVVAFGLIGIGRMHSETVRADVLDAVGVSRGALKDVIRGTMGFCAARGYRPVRWPIARSDPSAGVARDLGFVPRWSFDMLGRPLVPEFGSEVTETRLRDWRYAGVDYI